MKSASHPVKQLFCITHGKKMYTKIKEYFNVRYASIVRLSDIFYGFSRCFEFSTIDKLERKMGISLLKYIVLSTKVTVSH